MKLTDINWADPSAKISENFTVKDAVYLPSWSVYHIPSEEEKQNLFNLFNKIEQIREFMGSKPVNVHCAIRPRSVNCTNTNWKGKDYNRFVGGSPNSSHVKGLACDFSISSVVCDEVREHLIPELVNFDIFMEDRPKTNWIHINLPDGVERSKRFFKP